MAGTISISLQQQFHRSTGELLSGGRLDMFQAGTISTRQNAFRESNLVNPYSNPIILESDGRVPHLWFADGGIKIRLSDTTGVVQFEADNLPVIGSSGGGGGVDTTDPNSILSTGDLKFRASTGTLSGFVRANARTIGSATSGATERANADCEQLFLYFWNNFSDPICPVVTGRGANGAADWAANKQIGTFDMRGRGTWGVNDMGHTDAGRLLSADFVIGNATTGGSVGGLSLRPILQANLPSYTLPNTLGVAVANGTSVLHGTQLDTNTDGSQPNCPKSVTFSDITASITGSVTSGGSGTSLNTLNPAMLGAWYIRL